MSYESNFQRAGLAAVVPFLGGGLALTQVGLMGIIGYAGKVAEEGGNAFEYFYPGMHDFAPIMAILYTVSALPILLMVLKPPCNDEMVDDCAVCFAVCDAWLSCC